MAEVGDAERDAPVVEVADEEGVDHDRGREQTDLEGRLERLLTQAERALERTLAELDGVTVWRPAKPDRVGEDRRRLQCRLCRSRSVLQKRIEHVGGCPLLVLERLARERRDAERRRKRRKQLAAERHVAEARGDGGGCDEC